MGCKCIKINSEYEKIDTSKLTKEMELFLDTYKGKDLIQTAYDFRKSFRLNHSEASEIIDIWMNKNNVKDSYYKQFGHELGQQLITPLTLNKREELIDRIEGAIGTLQSMDWHKLNDNDLINLYTFATVQNSSSKSMDLLGEDKEIHRIIKNMEDQILKDE